MSLATWIQGPQNKMLGENPIALPQQDARMHESPGAAIQRQVIDMREAILLVVLLSDSEGSRGSAWPTITASQLMGTRGAWRGPTGISAGSGAVPPAVGSAAVPTPHHALGISASQVKAHLRLSHRVDGTRDRDLVTFINRFGKLDLRHAPCQPRLAEAVDQRIRHVGIDRHARHKAAAKTILLSYGVIMDLIGTGCRIIVGRERVRLELHTRGIPNA